MWSKWLAEEIARTLGYAPEALGEEQRPQAIVGELAEAFRYLPPDKLQLARDFASFLRGQSPPTGPGWESLLVDRLGEVRDLALFLKGRYGYEQPVDESDEWTEQDERDATLAALRRLDQEDPYPWEESD